MPKCPKCKSSIRYLRTTQRIDKVEDLLFKSFKVTFKNKTLNYELEHDVPYMSDYHCPECYEALAHTDDQAEEFFKKGRR